MEKSYLAVNPHGRQTVINEEMARRLRGQVKFIGEIVGVKYKNRGTGEIITSEEHKTKCFRIVETTRPDGTLVKKREKIEGAWERIYVIDKSSLPRGSGYRLKSIVQVGSEKETSKEQWLKDQNL